VVIFVVAILMSVAGSVIAAVQASRIWPVEALRYE
jgi:ABC-type lipoprotein release transport system permease subunit